MPLLESFVLIQLEMSESVWSLPDRVVSVLPLDVGKVIRRPKRVVRCIFKVKSFCKILTYRKRLNGGVTRRQADKRSEDVLDVIGLLWHKFILSIILWHMICCP